MIIGNFPQRELVLSGLSNRNDWKERIKLSLKRDFDTEFELEGVTSEHETREKLEQPEVFQEATLVAA